MGLNYEEERLISIIENAKDESIDLIKESWKGYKERFPPKVIEHLKKKDKLFLKIQQYNLSEIESFKDLPLYCLILKECDFKIKNIVGDSCLPNLKSLHIYTYDSINMEILNRSFPNIQSLFLKDFSSVSFKDYSGNKSLNTLNISGIKKPIHKLERYKEELSFIRYLDLSKVICKEVPLLETSEVASLTIKDSKIDSFKLLPSLKHLNYCDLSGSNVSEFNLEEYPNLSYLYLDR